MSPTDKEIFDALSAIDKEVDEAAKEPSLEELLADEPEDTEEPAGTPEPAPVDDRANEIELLKREIQSLKEMRASGASAEDIARAVKESTAGILESIKGSDIEEIDPDAYLTGKQVEKLLNKQLTAFNKELTELRGETKAAKNERAREILAREIDRNIALHPGISRKAVEVEVASELLNGRIPNVEQIVEAVARDTKAVDFDSLSDAQKTALVKKYLDEKKSQKINKPKAKPEPGGPAPGLPALDVKAMSWSDADDVADRVWKKL